MRTPLQHPQHTCSVVRIGGLAQKYAIYRDRRIRTEYRRLCIATRQHCPRLFQREPLRVDLRTLARNHALVDIRRQYVEANTNLSQQLSTPRRGRSQHQFFHEAHSYLLQT